MTAPTSTTAKTISSLLATVRAEGSRAALKRHSFGGLSAAEIKALAAKDMPTYTGKVRDVVTKGDELLIVHSDRLTAFDKLIAPVPYKGTILTAISEFWLKEAKVVVPTHFLGRPSERVLRTQRATPFKVEMVVRGYLAGSMMRAYEGGAREFCGARVPDGLKPFGRLPEPLITPTTKAAAFEHDENTTPAELIKHGIVTQKEWDELAEMTLKLFAFGQKRLASVGWILVDTKYEFGRAKDGRITVIDEIHTPDSSRFWVEKTYDQRLSRGEAPEMLDKETVRRWLMEHGYKGEGPVPEVPVDRLVDLAEVYLKVAETLTGRPLLSAGPDQVVSLG